jgi:hypothetical protein
MKTIFIVFAVLLLVVACNQEQKTATPEQEMPTLGRVVNPLDSFPEDPEKLFMYLNQRLKDVGVELTQEEKTSCLKGLSSGLKRDWEETTLWMNRLELLGARIQKASRENNKIIADSLTTEMEEFRGMAHPWEENLK